MSFSVFFLEVKLHLCGSSVSGTCPSEQHTEVKARKKNISGVCLCSKNSAKALNLLLR